MARVAKDIVLIFSIFSSFGSGNSEHLTINVPPSAAVLNATKNPTPTSTDSIENVVAENAPTCSCGVFLSGQFVKGSPKPPVGYPAIVTDLEDRFTCDSVGFKHCLNRCLEGLVKYVPNSPSIICGSVDRDTYKERAYLFVNNCNNGWKNSNMAAGMQYCCKNGIYYKCPLV